MKIKYKNKFSILGISILLIMGTFNLQSCKNEEKELTIAGGSTLKISLVKSEIDSEIITKQNDGTSANNKNASASSQTTSQKIGESNTMEVTLTPISTKSIRNQGVNGNISNKAALVQQILAPGTKYDIIIYSNTGQYLTKRTYTYGEEPTDIGIQLDAGKTYTVIATSTNSSTTTPTIIDQSLLSTATLANVNSQLMYFKKSITMLEGDNHMDVILKHQFSEITTKLHMDPNTTGSITEIFNPRFQLSHGSANLNLGTGAINYNGLATIGQTASYPGLGTGLREVTSAPTLLIHPDAINEVLRFERIKVDGEIKSPVMINNLKVNPGHRYDLDLLIKTCTQDVSGADGLDWDYPSTQGDWTFFGGWKTGIKIGSTFYPNGSEISKTFTAPSADYGFVLDILKLDNSFNMRVNSVNMASKEIQFENSASPAQVQNIQFEDGSQYGLGTVPNVFDMTGTVARPLIKIVISRSGVVTMFGSKTSGGPLFPLKLMTGTSFNTFSWNGTGTNTVLVTQKVAGKTTMKGIGSGKKKITCP